MIAGAPFVLYGMLALETNSSGFTQWLPDSQLARREYAWFVEHFGDDDFLLASWPGCVLDDDRVDQFAAALVRQAGPLAPGNRPRWIRRVMTGPETLVQLQARPLELAREEAISRLEGILVGSDRRATAALVELTDAGKQNQQDLVDLVYRVAADECGLSRQELRMGGSVFEAVEIEKETNRTLRYYALPVFLATLVIAYWCFRSLQLTVIVLVCAAYCRCISLALVYFTGNDLSAVLIVMPMLIYVLSISGAVHLVNYYRDAVREQGVGGAAQRALSAGWLPCTLAAVTTAIGMASLCLSQIPPVRTFGLFSAVSLLVSVVVLLLTLPSALLLWPQPGSHQRPDDKRRDSQDSGETLGLRVARTVIRNERRIVLSSLVMVALFGWGLTRVTTTIKLERMFSPKSQIIHNYHWLEERIGPLVSVEVIPRFHKSCSLDLMRRMDVVADIQRAVGRIPEVGGMMSTLTFVPPLPEREGIDNAVRRKVVARRVKNNRDRLIRERMLAETDDEELWRLSVRVPAVHPTDFEKFLIRIRAEVGSVIAAQRESGVDGIAVTYTGLLPMIDHAQRQLLDDLIKSFVLAVVLICPMMMIILRGFWSGLLSMIPNTVPVLVVFGGMGWLGIPVDVGAVLTASVALGIAVDDTLHVLTWYARGTREGLTTFEAIQNAYRRCALPMIQTTLICGLGLLSLAHSSFVPTSQFAWLILVLLLAALAGDLILLPALLAGPLGKVFRGSIRNQRTIEDPRM